MADLAEDVDGPEVAVLAHVLARPGTRDELGALLHSLVPPSRRHEGCLLYAVHTDPELADTFIFYERWASQDHLDRHLADAEISDISAAVRRLEPAIDMRVLRVDA